MSLNNLALTAANSAMTSAMGAMFDTLQSKLANWGRDNHCKFYYNAGAGGSILQVVAKNVVGGAVSALKDEGVNAFNSLFDKKKEKLIQGELWCQKEREIQEKEEEKYGKMVLPEGTVYALDDWGGIAVDALMLAIESDNDVSVTQQFPVYKADVIDAEKGLYRETEPKEIQENFSTKTLVWYDTTALITINSDKNLITTRVQGRDYSRKELVSNGDIKFSVTGQITSGKPDIYPAKEVQKFFQIMQYKGVVSVNNQLLDNLGISRIIIENFNLSPKEGYKAMQQYSFSAIGLQPQSEIEVTSDTVEIISQHILETNDDGSEWLKMLQNQLEGLKSMAMDLVSQGAGLAAGAVDNLMDKVL